MKKKLLFPVYICSLSFLINMLPALLGFNRQPFENSALISSTMVWFSYLLCLYFIGINGNNREILVRISIVMLAALILPLAQIIKHAGENARSAANGILPAMDVLLLYLSRTSLLLFSISILLKKAMLLRAMMFLFLIMIFTSFTLTVHGVFILVAQAEKSSLLSQISTYLNPVAIFSLFLLQYYIFQLGITSKNINSKQKSLLTSNTNNEL
jgi:uncharacterized membrane protein YqjE